LPSSHGRVARERRHGARARPTLRPGPGAEAFPAHQVGDLAAVRPRRQVGRLPRPLHPPRRLLLPRRCLRGPQPLPGQSLISIHSSISVGRGVGIGAAFTECSYIFNGSPPKWLAPECSIALTYSMVLLQSGER
uniref:Uncharacterized protein n=1 Tax=Aegilops tauschii subsp. strangulata TaxID=200361 RepID=A0A453J3V1_AEGTS